MTFFELIFVGILATALYCILFAIALDLIAKTDYDISLFLIIGYLGIAFTVILLSLKVLLVVC